MDERETVIALLTLYRTSYGDADFTEGVDWAVSEIRKGTGPVNWTETARVLEDTNPDRCGGFSNGVDWAVNQLRARGAEYRCTDWS